MRPDRIILICGTGTEVGKTWVGSRLLLELRSRGLAVAARKPAQSFDMDTSGERLGGPTDAELLGAASGEHPGTVCHSFRSYHRAMAPPMAAEALGLPPFTIADLVDEMIWPDHRIDVGVVETAGGVRAPQASDGDVVDFIRALEPDIVVLVADAGLGTIHGVRSSMDALAPVVANRRAADIGSAETTVEVGVEVGAGFAAVVPPARSVVVLDRFDARHDIHRRNLEWLTERDGYDVMTIPGEEQRLADLVAEDPVR